MSEQNNLFECPSCGDISVTFKDAEIAFPYGVVPDQIHVRATVPLGLCANCGLEFTDQRAERAKHDAVCKQIGLMAPSEIEKLRKSWGMSRQRFAEVTKIGEASVSRWERGAGFQNPAMDQLLYLLGFADNMRRLLDREAAAKYPDPSEANDGTTVTVDRFPNIKNIAAKQIESKTFQLRRAGA